MSNRRHIDKKIIIIALAVIAVISASFITWKIIKNNEANKASGNNGTDSEASGQTNNDATVSGSPNDDESSFIDKVLNGVNNDKTSKKNNESVEASAEPKLKEPLTSTGKVVTTLPDSYYGSDDKSMNNDTMNSISAIDYLKDTNLYIQRDIMSLGFTGLSSVTADSDSTTSMYALNRLKTKLEALETRNTNMKQYYANDSEVLTAWNNCYSKIKEAKASIEHVSSTQGLIEANSNINLTELSSITKNFDSIVNKRVSEQSNTNEADVTNEQATN